MGTVGGGETMSPRSVLEAGVPAPKYSIHESIGRVVLCFFTWLRFNFYTRCSFVLRCFGFCSCLAVCSFRPRTQTHKKRVSPQFEVDLS